MKKIRIAQIGTSQNSHGNDILKCLLKNNDIFEFVGYAFPENEREKFERANAFDGHPVLTVDEIMNDSTIEAVTIETEELYLTKYALMAAEHGKHIHMEKPGGIEPDDFERLIELVKKNQKVFHLGYMYRYNPYIMEVVEQVKNGEFGDIISVEAQMNCSHPFAVRDWLKQYPGGMMFFLGCHLVDLILTIAGTPDRVIPFNRVTGVENAAGEDFGMAVFEYKNGISFAKTNAVEYGGFERRQLVVTGTKKTVEIKPLEWYVDGGIAATKAENSSRGWCDSAIKETCEPFDRYDTMMRSFGKMVRGEMENPRSYDYELELYRTVLKACGCK